VPKLLYDALSHVNIYPDIESELSSSSRFRDIMHGVPKMGAGRGGLKMQEWKMREWKYRHETARKGRGWKMQE